MIALVGIVVVGPKELPRMLRKAGQWASKLRRMALDLRVQSGIDDVLRHEGLSDDLAEIRKLARGELDGVHRAAAYVTEPAHVEASSATPDPYRAMDEQHLRIREYPRDGADGYNAIPDTVVNDAPLPRSVWARDPLYMLGDPDEELPPDPVVEITQDAETAPGPVLADHETTTGPMIPDAETAPGPVLAGEEAAPEEKTASATGEA